MNIAKSIIVILAFFCALSVHAQKDSITILSMHQMSIEDLMQVKIFSASKKKELISDVPASAIIITKKQIESFGWKSLEEILMNVPGLYLIDQHKWSGMTGFGVRGYFTEGSFSNMIIMVNNSVASREGYVNQYIIDRIGLAVESINRIEVVRGPMSVMYGSGAFFGVINIITCNDNKDEKCGQNHINASYGTENTKRITLRVEEHVDDVDVNFNFSYVNTSGPDLPYTNFTSNPLIVQDDGTEISYLESRGLANSATTKNHLYKNKMNLNLLTKVRNISVSLNHTQVNKGIIWSAPTIDPDNNNVNIGGTDAIIQYMGELNKQISTKLKFSFGDYNSTSSYAILDEQFSGYSIIRSAMINMDGLLLFELSDKIDITVGALADYLLNISNEVDIPRYNVANSSWRLKPGDQIDNYDFYTQIAYTPIKKLRFIAGIRSSKQGSYTYQRLVNEGLENETLFEGVFKSQKLLHSFRLAGIYKLNDKNTVKILFGTANLVPNIRQNVTRLSLNGENRSQLEESTIETFEINYQTVLHNKIGLSVSVFQNHLNKLIESSGATASDGTYTVITQNSGKIETHGIESELNVRPGQDFNFSLGASYQQSKNKKEGFENIDLGYSPNLQVFMKGFYVIKNLNIGISGVYVDGMLTNWNQRDFDPNVGERYGNQVDAYVYLNANFRYTNLFDKPLYAGVYLTNILNQKILFATDPSNQWADKGLPGPQFNVLFTIGYNF